MVGPDRCQQARQAGTGGEGVLPGWPSCNGTVQPAPAGTVWHSSLALVARGTARVAWLEWHGLASPGRRHPAQLPCAGDNGELPGQPAYGSTVWPLPAGAIWRGFLVPAARGSCQGGPATAEQSCRSQQAPSSTATWCRRQGGADRAAQVCLHCLAAAVGAMWCSSSVLTTRGSCRGNPTTATQSCQPRQALFIAVALCRQQGGATRVAQLQWRWLAGPGNAFQHVSLAMTARGRCGVVPAMEAWSGQPWKALFGMAVPCWQRVGAFGAAQLQRPGLAGPRRRRPARQPSNGDEGALPGWHSNAGTVWPVAAGMVQRSSTRRWRGGTAGAAQLQLHSLAGPARHCPAWQLRDGGEVALPRRPSSGSLVRTAPAGTIRRGGLAAEVRGCCRGGPATAPQSGWPWQVPSGTAAPRWQRGGAAGAAQLWWPSPSSPSRHRPVQRPCVGVEGALLEQPGYSDQVGPGRYCPARRPSICGEGVQPGQPGYGSPVFPAPASTVPCGNPRPAASRHCRGA